MEQDETVPLSTERQDQVQPVPGGITQRKAQGAPVIDITAMIASADPASPHGRRDG